jgi:hypothetical protein
MVAILNGANITIRQVNQMENAVNAKELEDSTLEMMTTQSGILVTDVKGLVFVQGVMEVG